MTLGRLTGRRRGGGRRWAAAAAVALAAAGALAWTGWRGRVPREDLRDLPLRVVADLPLGGGSSRFDYLSLDPPAIGSTSPTSARTW